MTGEQQLIHKLVANAVDGALYASPKRQRTLIAGTDERLLIEKHATQPGVEVADIPVAGPHLSVYARQRSDDGLLETLADSAVASACESHIFEVFA